MTRFTRVSVASPASGLQQGRDDLKRYKHLNTFCLKLLQNYLISVNCMIFNPVSCAKSTTTKNKDGMIMAKKELIRLICEILKELPKEKVHTVYIFAKGLCRG